MNPNRVPGGAYVALMCDGVSVDLSSELAHSDPPRLFINDEGNVEAHVEDVPEGCEFTNGGGFIQQNIQTVLKVRENLCKIAQSYSDHKWLQETK